MVAPARSIFSFGSWDSDHPGERLPGDRLDAQFEELLRGQQLILEQLDAVHRSQQAVEAAARAVSARNVSSPNVLGYGAGGFYATDDDGATATSADYAQVAIEWAEHMPDTIPPSVLAINAITGDHWSSRWWANRAATLLSSLLQGGAGITAEQLTVTGPNTLSNLSYPAIDGMTTMQLIVNGRVFSGCATAPAFQVNVGTTAVSWISTLYGIVPGDEVIARYRFAASPPGASGSAVAVSLYYVATSGQTSFPLSTADRFGRSFALKPESMVQVSRNGGRLMPNDPGGVGAYAVAGDSVVLDYPAGQDEVVVIDVLSPQPPGTGWWIGLPTTLPPVSGVVWNNGGVICVS